MEGFGEELGPDVSGAFSDAIKSWRNPKSREASGPLAIVFTDIVGSTKTTQDHGDQGAQILVRAHSKVVRDALKAFAGKEVKHTGDGIMASFEQIGAASESAVQMLQALAKYNSTSPEIELHIRVGINAGDPIREDDDYFGSTVQMAARICDAAETDQAYVSNIVRELSGGAAVDFQSAGTFSMKGIDEPVTLYAAVKKRQLISGS